MACFKCCDKKQKKKVTFHPRSLPTARLRLLNLHCPVTVNRDRRDGPAPPLRAQGEAPGGEVGQR